jgi:transcriptional regulator with XRE-family HTH domain
VARSVEALVEPALLVWARERAGYRVEDAAKKAQVSLQRLASWERGEARPSVAQLKKLAEVYRRPLSVFYLTPPPKDFDPLHDFRRLHGTQPSSPSPQLRYEIRRAHERRDLALELYELAEGHRPASLPLRQSSRSNPDLLAAEIRRFLGVDRARQSTWGSPEAAFRHWRAALEARLVLVFQAPYRAR